MKAPLIKLQNLIHSYDGRLVLDVSELSVMEGEILVILGPTGSGKSTLLRVINLLERSKEGTIAWKGQPIGAKGVGLDLRRRVAMAFQDPLLFNTSVFDNVSYGLRLRHLPRPEIEERVGEILRLFSIEHLARRHSSQISGGEAQRVALARALVLKPELLLLDEPLASLDPETKDRLASELHQILKQLNTTTVFVTHSREEAFSLADRIGILDGGKILQIGTPEEVFYRPVSAQVASFVGTETLLSGLVIAQSEGLTTIDVSGKEVEAVAPFKEGEKVTVCIRPEEVIITKGQGPRQTAGGQAGVMGQGPRESARNHFPGKVKKIESIGPIAKVSLDCGFPLVAAITRRSALDLGLERGEDVVASFKATAVHVIEGSRVPPNSRRASKGQGSGND